MKTDELSPDDIIIACVISRSLPLALLFNIYVVSWAQLDQEKVVCVLQVRISVTLAYHLHHQFINAITGLETGVGHDLESCTSNVSNVRLSIPEIAFGDLVFVDTPGFDDTNKKDVDILKMVADWLKSTYVFVAVKLLKLLRYCFCRYEKNILLSGLLYFHRISDNRMAGTPLKNLRMFEELCGKNAFQNVILTTTMWDEVDEETGENRERELKTEYWRSMLERNSTTSRFLRTRESAFDLIDPLIDAANRRSSVLLQNELVDMRKTLPATAAGLELFSTMGQLVSQREDLLRRIRYEMRRSDGDKMILEPLQEEHQKLQNSLEATVIEMRRLRLPLGQRLLIMTDKFFSSKFESLKSLISKRLSKPAAPNTELLQVISPIDSYASVSHADYGDPIDRTHQFPPGSTSHSTGSLQWIAGSTTPHPIANGSNILSLAQGPTSTNTNRSKPTKPEEEWSQTNHSSLGVTTKEQAQDNIASSDQTTPSRIQLADRFRLDKKPAYLNYGRPHRH